MKKHPLHDQLRNKLIDFLAMLPELHGLLLIDRYGNELASVEKRHPALRHEIFHLSMIVSDLAPHIEMIRQQSFSELATIYVRYKRRNSDRLYHISDYVTIMPIGTLAYLIVAMMSSSKLGYPQPWKQVIAELEAIIEAQA